MPPTPPTPESGPEAEGERVIGRDDGEVDAPVAGERDYGVAERSDVSFGCEGLRDSQGGGVGDLRDAGVAGGDREGVELRRLAELPGDRVLAGAAADDEDVHDAVLCSK